MRYRVHDFNSIKVQLERNVLKDVAKETLFQFHKGTIRTMWGITQHHNQGYFNSIKVQLEPCKVWSVALAVGYFNSIKVQLEPNLLPSTTALAHISIP